MIGQFKPAVAFVPKAAIIPPPEVVVENPNYGIIHELLEAHADDEPTRVAEYKRRRRIDPRAGRGCIKSR